MLSYGQVAGLGDGRVSGRALRKLYLGAPAIVFPLGSTDFLVGLIVVESSVMVGLVLSVGSPKVTVVLT